MKYKSKKIYINNETLEKVFFLEIKRRFCKCAKQTPNNESNLLYMSNDCYPGGWRHFIQEIACLQGKSPLLADI